MWVESLAVCVLSSLGPFFRTLFSLLLLHLLMMKIVLLCDSLEGGATVLPDSRLL